MGATTNINEENLNQEWNENNKSLIKKEIKMEFIHNINEIKVWHIYRFNRKWLGEKDSGENNKGDWRACVVYGINKKGIKLIPLSSKKSSPEFTIKYNSSARKKISYICIDFFKILDPSQIENENICAKLTFNYDGENEHDVKINSKKIKKEIKDKMKKFCDMK